MEITKKNLNQIWSKIDQVYRKRTLNHISLVNKYAKKLGLEFPDHDDDKLHDEYLYVPYALFTYTKYGDTTATLSDDFIKLADHATGAHVKDNPHHPEYWDDTIEWFEFQRDRPPQNIDATTMTDSAIIEMVCDWCAMSDEFESSPYDWADKTINTRWMFTDDQIDLIYTTMDKIWENKND